MFALRGAYLIVFIVCSGSETFMIAIDSSVIFSKQSNTSDPWETHVDVSYLYRRLVVRGFATWEVLCDLGLEMPSASATPIVPFRLVSHVVSFRLCCTLHVVRTLLLGCSVFHN